MQTNANPSVLVSILNWNAAENTIETVQSVLSSTYKNYKIILLDNDSCDNSTQKLQSAFPQIELVTLSANIGYAAAHKKSAIKAIKENFDLLWILNNDVIVCPDTLAEMVQFFLKNPHGIYGGVCISSDGLNILFAGGLELNEKRQFDMKQRYNKFRGTSISDINLEKLTRQVGNVEGSNMLVPINIIKEHGFIKTSFFLYGEETDYSIRLWQKHKVGSFLVGKALVRHTESSSFASNKELEYIKLYYLTRNTEIIYRKYFNQPTSDSAASFWYLVKFFIKHLLRKSKRTDQDYRTNYYRRLAYFHVILGLKGKYLSPEKFFKLNI